MAAALRLENLRKTYDNGFEALKGVSFTIAQGDFFALLGQNGAGKSTIIGILASLVNKTSGQVQVFGHDLDREKALVKRSLGLVPQEFNFNVFEAVGHIIVQQAGYYGVPRAVAKKRARFYLEKLDLWGKRHDPARSLSGGMKRRLMIARALVHEPKLLVLDEPTAGVDVEIRHSMWEFIREVNQMGTTIILTSHYLEEIEALCRHVAILDHGEILAHNSMSELLSRLESQTFLLDLAKPLETPPSLQHLQTQLHDPKTLALKVPRGQPLNPAFSDLAAQGVQVLGVREKANRLETLFLGLLQGEHSKG